MRNFKKISIIVPVYNEERFIEKTIKAVIKSNTLNLKKEIIIVNDGSTDNTLNILKKIKSKHKNIKIINNKTNQGKGYSLKQGFLASTGDIVLVQDADLEYSPSDYPFLLSPFLKNEADVVYGSRFISDRPHRVLYFWHYLINQILTTFSNILTNLNLTDMETGFKVFKGSLIRKIAPSLKSKRFGFEPEITTKIAKIKDIKIYEVGISYFGRTYKEGKKINWIDGVKAFWEIIRFNVFN
ncbi:MAG: glycosyltransferase family 2 protein [Patescibacteria group bacterium]|nr:glycosyltransferase family 2 protein [Patescibacteria group bacterium]